MKVVNLAPYNNFVRDRCLQKEPARMMPSRPLNMPVMFSSVFQPVSTQSGPISVQNFKKILDIITPKIPEYAQYFKDRLAEYTILFDLNEESQSALLVEQMENIINTVETQTVGQYPELAPESNNC